MEPAAPVTRMVLSLKPPAILSISRCIGSLPRRSSSLTFFICAGLSSPFNHLSKSGVAKTSSPRSIAERIISAFFSLLILLMAITRLLILFLIMKFSVIDMKLYTGIPFIIFPCKLLSSSIKPITLQPFFLSLVRTRFTANPISPAP